MSRATEEQMALVEELSTRSSYRLTTIGEPHKAALRALLAERVELLKDRAFVDWFEENQSRIALEGWGAIAVAPMDPDKEPDWDKADCFQVGDNGRCVHPTIPLKPTLRKTVAYLIDAATSKSEEK